MTSDTTKPSEELARADRAASQTSTHLPGSAPRVGSPALPVYCQGCDEYMPVPHDCDKAREARALFEAAKRANDPESAKRLCRAAYQKAIEAEV